MTKSYLRQQRIAAARKALAASNQAHIKEDVPKELELLRHELTQPQHRNIFVAAQMETTFEAALGTVAAKLNIALDGLYDVPDLCGMLYRALQARPVDHVQAPPLPELQTVELVETDQEIHLLPVYDNEWQKEFAHKKDDTGALPPYTVCDSCKTEFDCCLGRDCSLGTPAQQLGWPVGHAGFKRSVQ